jgi:DNA polymerase-1
MEQAESTRLLIIDGHAYAYRAFHAIRRLNAPDGTPTNAIYGFIKMTGKMRAFLRPSHLAVIWDGGLAQERLAEHPEYKAQRPPMPADLDSQIGQIEEYLRAEGIATLCENGIEADDWIATMARATAPHMHVVIASSDKDFMQLVEPRVGLLNPNDKTERIWTADDVVAKAGVRPEQIVDWLSLLGDSVDNIPGVDGIGPKTAADLLRQFASLDQLYAGLEQVKSARVRDALQNARDALARNRRLIELKVVNQTVTLDALRIAERKTDVLRELFGRWGFKTMKAELDAANPAVSATVQQALL